MIEFEYSSYIYTFVPPACIFTLHKIFHTNFICFSFFQIIPKRKREIKFMPVWKIFNINKYMSPWMLTFAVFEFLDGHNLICFLQQIKKRGCIRGLCPQSKHFFILIEMIKIKWLLLYGSKFLAAFRVFSEHEKYKPVWGNHRINTSLLSNWIQDCHKLLSSPTSFQWLPSNFKPKWNL